MSMSSRKRSCDLNEDCISRLPDAILIHILSLLPSKDAANSVFIKRFHKLWPFIHTLNFDQCMFRGCYCAYYCRASRPDYDERFLNFVRHVLLLNKSLTIHKFCLKFHFSLSHSFRQRASGRTDIRKYDFLRSKKTIANEIGTWIQFALNKNLKVLDLFFPQDGTFEAQALYDLPNSVLSSPNLVKLRLTYCKINTKKKSELKFLTTLSLNKVMLMDQSMDYVLSGCPMLEELTLWSCLWPWLCNGHRGVVLPNPNLKKLVLGILWSGAKIHVSCPTLVSLDVFGTVDVLDIANIGSIAEVSVNRIVKFGFDVDYDYQEMRIFLQTITGAKSLKLCSWFALLKNLPSPTFSCKFLHLQLDFEKWHLPGILNLLKHCPFLEILIIKITSYFEPTFQSTWIFPYKFDAEDYWNMVDTPVLCLTHHLKTVEVAGLVMEKQVIQFLEYLLGHSMVLKKMKILAAKEIYGPNSIRSNKAHEYEQRLMNAPKISASAAILFY